MSPPIAILVSEVCTSTLINALLRSVCYLKDG